MRSFSMKDSKKDHLGHKTTITVTTENPEVIKSLMNTASEGEKKTTSNRTKSSKSNTSNKTGKNSSKKKKEVKALPAPKPKGKTKKKTVAKKAPVKTMTNTSVPKDETVIYSKGKWVITKKPIGGLYTYTLYEKDFCRAQLLFMPDDDNKAFKEFKDKIKE